jgi:single-strand DNA-binding protein
MASYNRVVLMGNLTRDVELRYTPSGTAVTDISIAVNERVKRNDQWTEEANFFDVTLWGRTAEIAGEYLSKGSSILIEGRLKQDRWEQDGQKKSKVKVIGERMQMLGSPKGSGGSNGSSAQPQTASASQAAPPQGPPQDDEVPF